MAEIGLMALVSYDPYETSYYHLVLGERITVEAAALLGLTVVLKYKGKPIEILRFVHAETGRKVFALNHDGWKELSIRAIYEENDVAVYYELLQFNKI